MSDAYLRRPGVFLGTLFWTLLLAYFFANVEIQIEGAAGWASALPTWRIEHHWLLDIFWGGRPMTGYHAWVFPCIALFFHFPLVFIGRWSWRTEARVLGCVMLFWLSEDFLWFVLNPAYGVAHFGPTWIPWHKHWWGPMPSDYWVFCVGLVSLLGLSLYPVAATAVPAAAPRNPKWAPVIDADGNLHQVAPTLYRSEQPLQGHADRLKALGVHMVISLRAFHADDRSLRGSGIQLLRIPMHTWHIRDDEVVTALRSIRAAEPAGPVLLHCQHGADRTGLVCAMYRVIVQGWSRDEALDELLHGGYGFHTMWRNIPRYLRRVDIETIRRRVEHAPPA